MIVIHQTCKIFSCNYPALAYAGVAEAYQGLKKYSDGLARMAVRDDEDIGGLISRNVNINGRRTSLRLEEEMWDGLSEVAKREGVTINDVVARIDRRRHNQGLTSSVRVFLFRYFRNAATDRGHRLAGHGELFGR